MSSIVIAGDTSGSVTLQAPAVSGSTVLNLPATSGTIQASGAGYTTNGVAYATSATGLATGSALTFDGTNLGVGIASAGTKVDVAGAVRSYVASGTPIFYLSNGVTQHSIQNNSGSLAFYNDGTRGMDLTSTGLGIGTSSPSYKLDVNGAVRSTDFRAPTSSTFFLTGDNFKWRSTGGTDYMVLDGSANLGLGVTPSTWSIGKAIEVNSVGCALWSAAAKDIRLVSNVYYASGDYKYASTGTASMFTMADDGAFRFYNAASGSTGGTITFSERARITSAGDFLVATTNTSSSAGVGLKINNTGGVYTVGTVGDTYNFYNSTAGAYRFYVTSAGVINATSTSISAISDIRLKENVRDLDVGLNAVMALKPRLYDWKEGKGADIKNARGFIAQEFEEVFPDLIDTWKDPAPEGEEPYKSVRQDLIPVLVKAIQEQQALITQLTERITALEAN